MISGGPHAQSSASNAQLQAARNQAAMEMELAKRRARKPTDKNIPEGVEDIIIGDGVQQYKGLREVERRLDAVMMRRRLDLQASRQQKSERSKTLRIWISNTVENQPWQGRELDENAFDFSTGNEATYKVKIEGRLLDDNNLHDVSDSEDEEHEESRIGAAGKDGDVMEHDGHEESPPKTKPPAAVQPRHRLSHFFKSITVDFDRNKSLQPDGASQIEWKKPPLTPNSSISSPAADFDCLEFGRKSDENINCTINLYRDESPDRYKLDTLLVDILDTEEETRAGIVMGIWEYVKAMNLQQDEEKRRIQCDDRLRAVSLHSTVMNAFVPFCKGAKILNSSSRPTPCSSRISPIL